MDSHSSIHHQVLKLLRQSAASMKLQADKGRRPSALSVGAQVWLSTAHLPLKDGVRKLAERWTGPFTSRWFRSRSCTHPARGRPDSRGGVQGGCCAGAACCARGDPVPDPMERVLLLARHVGAGGESEERPAEDRLVPARSKIDAQKRRNWLKLNELWSSFVLDCGG